MASVQTEYVAAPFVASVFAGPVFMLAAGLASGGLIPRDAIHVTPEGVVLFFMLTFWTTLLGFMIALLPTYIGTAIMAQIGKVSELSRIPAMWAAVGVGVVAIPTWLLGGFDPHDAPLAIAFAITGGVCALLCRRHTAWTDQIDRVAASVPTPPARAEISPRVRDPDRRLLR